MLIYAEHEERLSIIPVVMDHMHTFWKGTSGKDPTVKAWRKRLWELSPPPTQAEGVVVRRGTGGDAGEELAPGGALVGSAWTLDDAKILLPGVAGGKADIDDSRHLIAAAVLKRLRIPASWREGMRVKRSVPSVTASGVGKREVRRATRRLSYASLVREEMPRLPRERRPQPMQAPAPEGGVSDLSAIGVWQGLGGGCKPRHDRIRFVESVLAFMRAPAICPVARRRWPCLRSDYVPSFWGNSA